MARKTTKTALVALENQTKQMQYICQIIHAKAHVPPGNQAEHVRKPMDYWRGRAEGVNVMLEDILHQQGCYHGFSYVHYYPDGEMVYIPASDVQAGVYNEWCRLYHSK